MDPAGKNGKGKECLKWGSAPNPGIYRFKARMAGLRMESTWVEDRATQGCTRAPVQGPEWRVTPVAPTKADPSGHNLLPTHLGLDNGAT